MPVFYSELTLQGETGMGERERGKGEKADFTMVFTENVSSVVSWSVFSQTNNYQLTTNVGGGVSSPICKGRASTPPAFSVMVGSRNNFFPILQTDCFQ